MVGIALYTLNLEKLQAIAVIFASMAMIKFENVTTGITAITKAVQLLKNELGDLSDRKTVAVTSVIENLATISTGGATRSLTAARAGSGRGSESQKVNVDGNWTSKIDLILDGDVIKSLIHDTVPEIAGGKTSKGRGAWG